MMTPVCRTNDRWTVKFPACLRSYELRIATLRVFVQREDLWADAFTFVSCLVACSDAPTRNRSHIKALSASTSEAGCVCVGNPVKLRCRYSVIGGCAGYG